MLLNDGDGPSLSTKTREGGEQDAKAMLMSGGCGREQIKTLNVGARLRENMMSTRTVLSSRSRKSRMSRNDRPGLFGRRTGHRRNRLVMSMLGRLEFDMPRPVDHSQ